MLAIVTGTISPDSNMALLQIKDTGERLEQYRTSLFSLIKSRAFSKIVFCENSNYGIKELKTLQPIAEEENVQLELLSFQGNTRQALQHGKGYGEGETMEHVLQNSRLAEGEDFFVKLTGRLEYINIKQIVEHLKSKKTYFNVPNHWKRELYDTRIYAMPVKQFQIFFQKAYCEVEDEQGIYLEHVYTEILEEHKIKVVNLPRYPRIKGMSGTTRFGYDYVEWKCKIRDVLSMLNFYSVTVKR